MSNKTLFQKIADREINADIVYEDEQCMALNDINPQAPVHILIVPREPIASIDDLREDQKSLMGHLVSVAKQLAGKNGLSKGYRLVFNCGDDGGQSVYHIHLHLLGGRKMSWPPG